MPLVCARQAQQCRVRGVVVVLLLKQVLQGTQRFTFVQPMVVQSHFFFLTSHLWRKKGVIVQRNHRLHRRCSNKGSSFTAEAIVQRSHRLNRRHSDINVIHVHKTNIRTGLNFNHQNTIDTSSKHHQNNIKTTSTLQHHQNTIKTPRSPRSPLCLVCLVCLMCVWCV